MRIASFCIKNTELPIMKDSIDVQGDNTVDKGLISSPFALLSLRVRPVRVDQVPERGQKSSPFRLVDSKRRNFSDLQGRRLRRTGRTPIEDNTVNHGNYTVWSVLSLVHRCYRHLRDPEPQNKFQKLPADLFIHHHSPKHKVIFDPFLQPNILVYENKYSSNPQKSCYDCI